LEASDRGEGREPADDEDGSDDGDEDGDEDDVDDEEEEVEGEVEVEAKGVEGDDGRGEEDDLRGDSGDAPCKFFGCREFASPSIKTSSSVRVQSDAKRGG